MALWSPSSAALHVVLHANSRVSVLELSDLIRVQTHSSFAMNELRVLVITLRGSLNQEWHLGRVILGVLAEALGEMGRCIERFEQNHHREHDAEANGIHERVPLDGSAV